MMLLTRSPIETMPRSSPPLITGRWRTRLALMIAMPSSIDLSGLTHTTSRTMISPTSVCGDARPLQKHVASVVPLGKDADDLVAVEHQQRADVLVGHHLDRVVHRVARMDGPYLMTLLIENVTNCCHDGTGQRGKARQTFANLTPGSQRRPLQCVPRRRSPSSDIPLTPARNP